MQLQQNDIKKLVSNHQAKIDEVTTKLTEDREADLIKLREVHALERAKDEDDSCVRF